MINLKKGISILCTVGMLCAFPAEMPVYAADTEQKCGDNITWCYEQETRSLIPEGTGSIYDYDREGNFAPWCDLSRYRIEHLSVSDGITSIGDCAFYMVGCFILCPKLSDMTVPETVTEIGNYVFTDCSDWYRAQTDGYVILGDGILCKYLGKETDLVIPHFRLTNPYFCFIIEGHIMERRFFA